MKVWASTFSFIRDKGLLSLGFTSLLPFIWCIRWLAHHLVTVRQSTLTSTSASCRTLPYSILLRSPFFLFSSQVQQHSGSSYLLYQLVCIILLYIVVSSCLFMYHVYLFIYLCAVFIYFASIIWETNKHTAIYLISFHCLSDYWLSDWGWVIEFEWARY